MCNMDVEKGNVERKNDTTVKPEMSEMKIQIDVASINYIKPVPNISFLNEGPMTRPYDYYNETPQFFPEQNFGFSENDYSAECRNLEKELLDECDGVLEDINKERQSNNDCFLPLI